jgi:hypothetical protein
VIYRKERQLADAVAAGELTVKDADAVRTFATFLHEVSGLPRIDPATGRLDRAQLAAARRWIPYMLGEADGPAEP